MYDSVPDVSDFLGFDKLLKNANVSQSGMGKRLTTALYSETISPEKLLHGKKPKIKKQTYASKNYTHSCNIEILCSCNPEPNHKNTKFAIKYKLKYLLNELRGFIFAITLVLKFKKSGNNRRWNKIRYFLLERKSRNNYSRHRHWQCTQINLSYDYDKKFENTNEKAWFGLLIQFGQYPKY